VEFSRRNFLISSAIALSTLPGLSAEYSYAAEDKKIGPLGARKFVDVGGIKTSYFEAGSGEAMVLVHGAHFGSAAGSALNWLPSFPLLARNFHVYALDKLGMGSTDNPSSDADYSMRGVVDHIHGFIQTMGIKKLHLVGHSRGGLPVMRIAIDHPDVVETLTICDSNTTSPADPPPVSADIDPMFTGGPLPTKETIREEILKGAPRFPREYLTETADAQLEIALAPKTRQVAERLELLRSRFVEKNPDKVNARPALRHNSGTGWWLYQVKDETLDQLRAGRLKQPTLVIWGFNDAGAPYKLGIELFEMITKSAKRAQMHVFNECGHFAFQEYPKDFEDLLVGFIKNSRT
jgi:2-hydroxy-6-oxonona-2,4-dienedioate hydrolase